MNDNYSMDETKTECRVVRYRLFALASLPGDDYSSASSIHSTRPPDDGNGARDDGMEADDYYPSQSHSRLPYRYHCRSDQDVLIPSC